MKVSYAEMIQDALCVLKNKGGSSRQAVWKCVAARNPDADYKQFVVRLKKLTGAEGSHVVLGKNKQRFQLSAKLADRIRGLNKRSGKPVTSIKLAMAVRGTQDKSKVAAKKAAQKEKRSKRAASKKMAKKLRGDKKKAAKKASADKKKAAKAKKAASIKKKAPKSKGNKKTQNAKNKKKTQNKKKVQKSKAKN